MRFPSTGLPCRELTHRKKLSPDMGRDDFGQVVHLFGGAARNGFFAERAGRDDCFGSGGFQFCGNRTGDGCLLSVRNGRVGDRRVINTYPKPLFLITTL